MKCVYSLLIALTFFLTIAHAQDEGVISKKERISKSNNIFISGGPSFTFGENIGDYSTGYNVEVGFVKRLNRVFSIGPSISYIKFNYDPSKTRAEDGGDLYVGNTADYGGDINNWHVDYDVDPNYQWDFGYLLDLEGGNISLLSLSVNLKLNLVPINDQTKFSVYLFAKPFITNAKRDDVTGSGTRYVYEAYEDEEANVLYFDTADDTWYEDGQVDHWGPTSYPALKAESNISGGIFLGPGLEFMPARTVTVFLQPAIGYTFPISFVSTASYDFTVESYLKDEFPIVKKGFTSLNVQFGVSFNF
jgi:hypothetical protein